jgi:hypothetical protein
MGYGYGAWQKNNQQNSHSPLPIASIPRGNLLLPKLKEKLSNRFGGIIMVII